VGWKGGKADRSGRPADLETGEASQPAEEERRLVDELHVRAMRIFNRSLHIRHVDAGSCNGCEAELQMLATPSYDLARLRYDQSLALARQVDNRYEQVWSLHNLGCLALDQGDYPAARAWLAESLKLRDEHDRVGWVHMLAEFAALAAAEGLSASALRVAGATARVTQKTGIPVQHSERGRYERWLAAARQALGEEAAAAAWTQGYQMRLDQDIAYAMAPCEPVASTVSTAADLRVTSRRPARGWNRA